MNEKLNDLHSAVRSNSMRPGSWVLQNQDTLHIFRAMLEVFEEMDEKIQDLTRRVEELQHDAINRGEPPSPRSFWGGEAY